MRMGEAEIDEGIQVVSTGSLGLDIALGVGGLPAAGWSKSTARNPPARPPCVLQVVAEMQKLGAWRPSSTPSTPSTRSTRRSWASMWATC